MPLDFYTHPMSPPCRSVMMVAKAVGVELNHKKIDVLAGETRTPEFMAINPQHTIPALVDGNIKLWESRVICTYLASQYGKDDTLYPNNPRARCLVDARLAFDFGTLYRRFADYAFPAFRGEPINPKGLELIEEALGWLNSFLADFTFVAGNKVTVADYCLVATVSTIEAVGIEIHQHSRVVKWLGRCKIVMPGYEELNGLAAKQMGQFLKEKIEAVLKTQQS